MNDQELQIKNFSQTWPKPSKNNPIIIQERGGQLKMPIYQHIKKLALTFLDYMMLISKKQKSQQKNIKLKMYMTLQKKHLKMKTAFLIQRYPQLLFQRQLISFLKTFMQFFKNHLADHLKKEIKSEKFVIKKILKLV